MFSREEKRVNETDKNTRTYILASLREQDRSKRNLFFVKKKRVSRREVK